jgi:hypothetical protein
MAGKNNDVLIGKAMLTTGAVEAIVNLKANTVAVRLDTDRDGLIDTQIIGTPADKKSLLGLNLEAMLYKDGIALARDGGISESDARSLGILARGINDTNRGGR